MTDRHHTIITQYKRDNSNLCDIIDRLYLALNLDADLQAFYDHFFNINTSVGVWLDIWGVIVGVDRWLTVPVSAKYWGFNQAGDALPFNDGIFYTRGTTVTDTYALSDEIFRRVVIAKAMANIAACDVFSLNSILKYFFAGRGKCYVTTPSNMTLNYVFEFYLEPWEKALFTQDKVFPRPAGVKVNALELPSDLWGFHEAFDYQPFNQGIFFTTG